MIARWRLKTHLRFAESRRKQIARLPAIHRAPRIRHQCAAFIVNRKNHARSPLHPLSRGVGEILALSWALEIGEVQRFPSIAEAVSYCGLTSARHNSAGQEHRGPISKQRNKHLQTILIEAAKLAPRYNPQLAAVHERELKRGDRNRATLAVARKLVAYLMAVDKSGKPFQVRASAGEAN